MAPIFPLQMGTLTTDVVRAIRETRQGRLDYRLGRDGAVRAALGRASMPASQLAVNVGALVASLLENRPKAAAGGVAGAGGGAIAAGKGGAAGSASGQELEGKRAGSSVYEWHGLPLGTPWATSMTADAR